VHGARWKSAGVLGLTAALAGCGGGAGTPAKPTSPQTGSAGATPSGSAARSVGATPSVGAGPAAGREPPARAVAVIRDWSRALAGGDVQAAARYFATPSVIQLDPTEPSVTLRTPAAARAANMALPCGASLLGSRVVDGYIDALFLLGNRPGGDCGTGTGQTARVAFVIESGRISDWRRIPDEPGDSAHDAPGASAPGTGAPTGPGPGSSVSAV
jgi:hypothetical protein